MTLHYLRIYLCIVFSLLSGGDLRLDCFIKLTNSEGNHTKRERKRTELLGDRNNGECSDRTIGTMIYAGIDIHADAAKGIIKERKRRFQ